MARRAQGERAHRVGVMASQRRHDHLRIGSVHVMRGRKEVAQEQRDLIRSAAANRLSELGNPRFDLTLSARLSQRVEVIEQALLPGPIAAQARRRSDLPVHAGAQKQKKPTER